MNAYVFPGQGSQFPGMGQDLYNNSGPAKGIFEEANRLLGFRISDVMFKGTEQDLMETRVTQPAIFLHSMAVIYQYVAFQPDMVAGHSLGEFSALVAAQCITFREGLILVSKRAEAMQKACALKPSTMAAVMGLSDEKVEEICASIEGEIVVPANYNCPGQLVISGSIVGIELACKELKLAGAKRTLVLSVGGAFHSPFMEPARLDLEKAIEETNFHYPSCPIYQNVTALPSKDPGVIKKNLIAQLTAPVRWSQTIERMIMDGASHFSEVGPGKVLQGLIRKMNQEIKTESA